MPENSSDNLDVKTIEAFGYSFRIENHADGVKVFACVLDKSGVALLPRGFMLGSNAMFLEKT